MSDSFFGGINGEYYLDKEKLAQAKAQISSKNTK
jgi:hypothetical protein